MEGKIQSGEATDIEMESKCLKKTFDWVLAITSEKIEDFWLSSFYHKNAFNYFLEIFVPVKILLFPILVTYLPNFEIFYFKSKLTNYLK